MTLPILCTSFLIKSFNWDYLSNSALVCWAWLTAISNCPSLMNATILIVPTDHINTVTIKYSALLTFLSHHIAPSVQIYSGSISWTFQLLSRRTDRIKGVLYELMHNTSNYSVEFSILLGFRRRVILPTSVSLFPYFTTGIRQSSDAGRCSIPFAFPRTYSCISPSW